MNETERREIELTREAAAGKKARELLENPLLATWFAARRAELFEAFAGREFNDDEGRRAIWLRLQAVNELEKDLHTTIQSGTIAETNLKEWYNHTRGR